MRKGLLLLAIGLLVFALVMAAGCTSSSPSSPSSSSSSIPSSTSSTSDLSSSSSTSSASDSSDLSDSVNYNELPGIWVTIEEPQYWYLFIFPDGHAIFGKHMQTHPNPASHDKLSNIEWKESSNGNYIFKGMQAGTYKLSDSGLQFTQIPSRIYQKLSNADIIKRGMAKYSLNEEEFAHYYMESMYELLMEDKHPEWYFVLDYLKTHNIDQKNTIPNDIEKEINAIAGSYPVLDLLGISVEDYMKYYTVRDVHAEYNPNDNRLTIYYDFDLNLGNSVEEQKGILYGTYDKTAKTFKLDKLDYKSISPNKYYHEIYYYNTNPMTFEYKSDINVKETSGSESKYDYYETYDEKGNLLKKYT